MAITRKAGMIASAPKPAAENDAYVPIVAMKARKYPMYVMFDSLKIGRRRLPMSWLQTVDSVTILDQLRGKSVV